MLGAEPQSSVGASRGKCATKPQGVEQDCTPHTHTVPPCALCLDSPDEAKHLWAEEGSATSPTLLRLRPKESRAPTQGHTVSQNQRQGAAGQPALPEQWEKGYYLWKRALGPGRGGAGMPALRAEGGGQSGGLKVRGWSRWGGVGFLLHNALPGCSG